MGVLKKAGIGLLVAVALVIALGFWRAGADAGNPPPGLALDGTLQDCPDKPNCVSSEDGDVPPLPALDKAEVKKEMASRGAFLVDEGADYLAFTVTSAFFGFVDDVEFRFTDAATHIRSASRTGHSDFGVNGARVADIRDSLTE